MRRVDFVVAWLAISIVLLSILVAWAFVRWFDAVMLHVVIGAIFGMLATVPIWLLVGAAYRDRSEPVARLRPTVTRCDDGDAEERARGAIYCEWGVIQ